MIVSALESYFIWIKRQMAAMSAQVSVNGVSVAQPMGEIVNSKDWPMAAPVEGALYLLFLSANPTGQISQAQVEYELMCQWSWYLIGSDLSSDQVGASRGDRFRSGMQVIENLRQASYPGFCQQKDSACDGTSVTFTASESQYPYSPIEIVRWTNPRFVPRADNQSSGLLYGVATVELYAYSDVSVAIA